MRLVFGKAKLSRFLTKGEWVTVRWDSITLRKKMPLSWIKMVENAQSDWETMNLPAKRLIPGETRDEEEDVRKAVKEIYDKLGHS